MRFLSWNDIAEQLGVSLSTAKRLANDDPDFPRRVRISPQRVGFPEPEFEKWQQSLIQFRDRMEA
jgi:predicted DNA-binding transcriptional regulator AlpA